LTADDQTTIAPRIAWLIQHAPPPKPACYDTDLEWRQYLTSVVESGEPVTRIEDTAKWTTINGRKVRTERTVRAVWKPIPFCDDCAIGSPAQRAKQQAGRCVMPPLPYTKQLALFDAATDTTAVNRPQMQREAAKRKMDRRIAMATEFLQGLGFGVTAPTGWVG
jgi:hypothetical protein